MKLYQLGEKVMLCNITLLGSTQTFNPNNTAQTTIGIFQALSVWFDKKKACVFDKHSTYQRYHNIDYWLGRIPQVIDEKDPDLVNWPLTLLLNFLTWVKVTESLRSQLWECRPIWNNLCHIAIFIVWTPPPLLSSNRWSRKMLICFLNINPVELLVNEMWGDSSINPGNLRTNFAPSRPKFARVFVLPMCSQNRNGKAFSRQTWAHDRTIYLQILVQPWWSQNGIQ